MCEGQWLERIPTGGAVVKQVFGAAPDEGFIGSLLPDGFEELDCLTVGEDIEEAQEFLTNAADVDKRAGRNALLTSEAD